MKERVETPIERHRRRQREEIDRCPMCKGTGKIRRAVPRKPDGKIEYVEQNCPRHFRGG